jgi:hypothetical protein
MTAQATMATASYLLPLTVKPSRPHQYVSYINDPAIASIASSSVGAKIVVNRDDQTFSWENGDWKLCVSNSAIFGAVVLRSFFCDAEFISLVLNFPEDDGAGYKLLTGPLEAADWFRNLAGDLSSKIPGGIKWRL